MNDQRASSQRCGAVRKNLLLLGAMALLSSLAARSQTLTTLYNFQGPPNDAEVPCAITPGPGGGLLGTSLWGGPSNFGTVFKIDGEGKETVVHSFTGGEDGQDPCALLASGPQGTLFGVTNSGGSGNEGAVFEIQHDQLIGAYDFVGLPAGAFPTGVTYSAGDLYGTAANGGGGQCPFGCGTIFKLDRFGHETVLHEFQGPDGAYPGSGVVRDREGNLYGTTEGGGDNSCPNGCGTVFELDKSGNLIVMHDFTYGTGDGWFVATRVIRDSEGNLYGTTSGGGAYGFGTVYEITNVGKERVLYSFQGPPDGATPEQLTLAPNGNLFGVTVSGGLTQCAHSGGCGTVFKLDTRGKETVLYRFGGVTDGAAPAGNVLLDSHGNLYGTTTEGIKDGCSAFSLGCGTVWKLEVPAVQTGAAP